MIGAIFGLFHRGSFSDRLQVNEAQSSCLQVPGDGLDLTIQERSSLLLSQGGHQARNRLHARLSINLPLAVTNTQSYYEDPPRGLIHHTTHFGRLQF